MKRNELKTLGLTPEQIDAVMTMNGNDVNREKAKSAAQTGNEVQRLRESCVTLLDLLESPEAVRGVLRCVSRLYSEQERRKARKEYPGGVLKTTTPQLHFTTGCILQLLLNNKKKAAHTVGAAWAANGR